jgi:hypothetical protein
MGKFDAFFEEMEADESVFGGTPQSKFWDFYNKLSIDLKENEFDKIVERFAAMELMLQEHIDEEALNQRVKSYIHTNFETLEERKKSLYLEFAGDLLFQFDS